MKFYDKSTDKVVSVKHNASDDENVFEQYNLNFGQDCQFDVYRDIQEVESGLSVNINDMLRTGIVKDSPINEPDNGIEEPSQIIGRIADTFDAIEAKRVIEKYGKKSASKVKDVVQNDNPVTSAPDKSE